MIKRNPYAKNYLERHLGQPSNHPDLAGYCISQASLWDSADIKTKNTEDGLSIVEVDFGRNNVEYSYADITDEYPSHSTNSKLYTSIRDEPWRYRELKTATIHNTESDARLDLVKALPEDWHAFIDLTDRPGAWSYPNAKVVTITPQFGNKFIYFALAHEVGHAWDSIKNPSLYEDSWNSTERDARLLKGERNANAFALYYLRPFLSNEAGDAFNSEAFREEAGLSLQTYRDRIIKDQGQKSARVRAAAKMSSVALLGGVIAARKMKGHK